MSKNKMQDNELLKIREEIQELREKIRVPAQAGDWDLQDLNVVLFKAILTLNKTIAKRIQNATR